MSAKLRLYDLDLGDGRIRKVRLDLGALEDAEEVSGHNYLARGLGGASAKALRALVWASLRHEDPDLTPDRVREMVHAGNWSDVIGTLVLAYAQAMPEESTASDDGEGEGESSDPLAPPATPAAA